MALVKWGVQVCEMCNCILDDDLNCPECEICNGEKMEEKFDEVNNPPHYTIRGGIECIDYINAWGMDYLQGNIIKYVTRYELKNGVEDLEKARFYLNMLIEREGMNE